MKDPPITNKGLQMASQTGQFLKNYLVENAFEEIKIISFQSLK